MATTLLGSTGASRRTADSGQRLPVNATGPNGWLASSATSSPSTTPKATSPSCENLAMRIPRGYASRERHRGGRTVMPMRRPAAVIAVAAGVFVVVTALVAVGATDGLDSAVRQFADRHHSAAGVTAARLLSDALQPAVDAIVLLAGAGLLAHRERRLRPFALAAVVVGSVSAGVLAVKYAVDRPLPHSHRQGALGFPSGHTAATASFLGVLAVLLSARRPAVRRRLLVLVAGLTVLVALAVVYAGYHWLTDTLASIALSVAVLGTLALERLRATWEEIPARRRRSGSRRTAPRWARASPRRWRRTARERWSVQPWAPRTAIAARRLRR